MAARVNDGLRSGAILGVILIFLILIGFPANILLPEDRRDLAELIDTGFAVHRPAMNAFLGFMGVFAGLLAARKHARTSFISSLLLGLATGIVGGAIFLIFVVALPGLSEMEIEDSLVQLTPNAIGLLLFGGPALVTGLTYWAVLSAAGLVGGLLAYLREWLRAPFGFVGRTISKAASRVTPPAGSKRDTALRYVVYALLLLGALALPLPAITNSSMALLLAIVGIFTLLGLGLNIVVGLAGLLDLGYVAFYAIGAYSVALLTAPEPLGVGLSFFPALLIGIFLAALSGILLGVPVLRLRGDYLAIVTLGLGEIISIMVGSQVLKGFTGGSQGVHSIPRPGVLQGMGTAYNEYLYLIILGVLIVIFVTARLHNSRIGRAWIAMREDETVAQAIGINTLRYKLLAFATGAAFAGLGGGLFASLLQSLAPDSFQLEVSIDVLALVIVGGMGSIPGVILGAFVLRGLPQLMQGLEDYRVLTFGALLVAMMIFRPEGIWPSRRRRLEIQEAWDDTEQARDVRGQPPKDVVGEEVFS